MLRRLYLIFVWAWLLAFALPAAASGINVAIGVNVVNPQRLGAAERTAILDQLQAAGVRLIRVPLAPAWSGNDYAPAIDFIARAHQRGIETDLIVGLQYSDTAQRRAAVKDMPNMWRSYPLSAADPVRFRAVFAPLFQRLEEIGITFAALEFSNEINWAAFNGDFPVPGEGRVFGIDDLSRDPEARQIARGYRAYLQSLSVLKDIRDHSRLNRATPILSAGLSDPGPAGPRPGMKADAVSIGATLDYLRLNGLDSLVDAYGVHTYPAIAAGPAARLYQIEHDTLADCRLPGQGKPCWLTEWGLPATAANCAAGDSPRAALASEMVDDFRSFVQQGRLQALIYFAWVDHRYGLYRCGTLTRSGQRIIAQN